MTFGRKRQDFSMRDEAREAQTQQSTNWTPAPPSPNPNSKAAMAAQATEAKTSKFAKKSSSFSAVVTDLEVGDCASRVQAIPGTLTIAQMAEKLSGIKSTLLNNSTVAIRTAKQATGGTYSTTVSDTITAGGEVFVVLIVKRTA